MSDLPTHLIESSRYGLNHGGRHRLAYGSQHVRNSLKGLVTRYPKSEIRVLALPGFEDVTTDFMLGGNDG